MLKLRFQLRIIQKETNSIHSRANVHRLLVDRPCSVVVADALIIIMARAEDVQNSMAVVVKHIIENVAAVIFPQILTVMFTI